MALVTIQRSPSPSTENDLDTNVGSSDDGVDGRSSAIKRSLSDSYFTVNGAALILPNNEYSKKSSRKSHGGEIHGHLQSMLHLLRPEDKIKIAVRLEDIASSKYRRYMALVATLGRQDTEEAVILGIDCDKGESYIRLVLPVWLGVKLQLGGDGGFSLTTDQQAYLFNPVSVQALWSAFQSLVKVIHKAEDRKYLQEGLTHTWVDYYRGRVNADLNRNSHWDVEGVEIFAPSCLSLEDDENETVKQSISTALRDVMMNVDLDEATSRSLRLAVEEKLGICLKRFKSYFDEEVMRILGQMDAPSQILDYLYLGSEWNASNLDELKEIGIGYILNITQEIDNFFSGMFQYFNVRLPDIEESDLLKHWDKTYKFISKARDHGSKVLVHCKMGVSRSASSVMAYLMKFNRWGVAEAHDFVKARRSCVRPNSGFMAQLDMYEAILSASNKRDIFRVKSNPNLIEDNGKEEAEQCQGFLLGDSLFNVMSKSEWITGGGGGGGQPLEQEEEWLRANLSMEPGMVQMETDLETVDSRSGDSVEETHPDIPSPTGFGGIASSLSSTTALERHVGGYESAVDAGACLSQSDEASGHNFALDADSSVQMGGLQSRIKPDSSWIKMDTAEMDGEASSLVATEATSGYDDGGSQREGQFGSSVDVQSSPNIVHTSPDDRWPADCARQYHEGSTSATQPTQSRLDDVSNNVNNLQKFPAVQSSSEHEFMQTDDNDTMSSIPAPHTFIDNSNANAPFDKNQNLMEDSNASDNEPFVDILQSVFPNREEASSEEISSSSKKVEVGVREYFFREKIPWNPGKVQKIREGINRTGNLLSNASEESSSPDLGSPCDDAEESMAVDIDSGEESGFATKEDVSPHKDEITEIHSGDAIANSEIYMEGSSVSLYDKEDIPLEPGTVLRTRMEIEERQRSWHETGETTQSKPVSRTSSLKHTDISSHQSEASKRRVSCGPVIGHGQMNNMDAVLLPSEEEESLSTVIYDAEHASAVSTAEEEKEGSKDADSFISDQGVSLQVFGDDVTIQSGLVKKHRMEIETKQDMQSIPATISTDSDDSCPQTAGRSGHSPETNSNSHSNASITSLEHKTSNESNLDKNTLALIREIGSDLIMESQTEQVAEEKQELQEGSEASNVVKLFVSKIEKQSHPPNPRKIVIVESTSDNEKQTPLSTASLEDTHNEALKSQPKLDLGFAAGESYTEDASSMSPSKVQAPGVGEGGELSVVRHLVDRFEVRSPDECLADASEAKDGFHGEGNVTVRDQSSKPEHASDDGKTIRTSFSEAADTFGSHPSSSKPVSLSTATAAAGHSHSAASSLSSSKQSIGQRASMEIGAGPTSSDTEQLFGINKAPWRKSAHQPISRAESAHTVTSQDPQQPFQRARPKSADPSYNVRFVEEDENVCSQETCQSASECRDGSEDGKSGTFLRQVSEEGRKIRKLHGKSHPLSKLTSAHPQPQKRGGPFHSSM